MHEHEHVPNYHIAANTLARTNSSYRHIHFAHDKSPDLHDRILSDRHIYTVSIEILWFVGII